MKRCYRSVAAEAVDFRSSGAGDGKAENITQEGIGVFARANKEQ
jgi:hypothetical protein